MKACTGQNKTGTKEKGSFQNAAAAANALHQFSGLFTGYQSVIEYNLTRLIPKFSKQFQYILLLRPPPYTQTLCPFWFYVGWVSEI